MVWISAAFSFADRIGDGLFFFFRAGGLFLSFSHSVLISWVVTCLFFLSFVAFMLMSTCWVR